jgi:hypothetical protein
MNENKHVVKGVLLLAQDGMHTVEEHHFDDGVNCFCSQCMEKNQFVPKIIVLPN